MNHVRTLVLYIEPRAVNIAVVSIPLNLFPWILGDREDEFSDWRHYFGDKEKGREVSRGIVYTFFVFRRVQNGF